MLRTLLHALGECAPFLVLRNYAGLPDEWDNDVDILIRPGDLQVVRAITLATFRSCSDCRPIESLQRLDFWGTRLLCADRELQVDYYAGISKGWVSYADVEKILAGRTQVHELFSAPDPVHEALLIAAKELFAYGKIRARYHARLRGHDEVSSLSAARALFGGRLTEGGCTLVANALQDPTITGRPAICLPALLRPGAALAWARLRRRGWAPFA